MNRSKRMKPPNYFRLAALIAAIGIVFVVIVAVSFCIGKWKGRQSVSQSTVVSSTSFVTKPAEEVTAAPIDGATRNQPEHRYETFCDVEGRQTGIRRTSLSDEGGEVLYTTTTRSFGESWQQCLWMVLESDRAKQNNGGTLILGWLPTLESEVGIQGYAVYSFESKSLVNVVDGEWGRRVSSKDGTRLYSFNRPDEDGEIRSLRMIDATTASVTTTGILPTSLSYVSQYVSNDLWGGLDPEPSWRIDEFQGLQFPVYSAASWLPLCGSGFEFCVKREPVAWWSPGYPYESSGGVMPFDEMDIKEVREMINR